VNGVLLALEMIIYNMKFRKCSDESRTEDAFSASQIAPLQKRHRYGREPHEGTYKACLSLHIGTSTSAPPALPWVCGPSRTGTRSLRAPHCLCAHSQRGRPCTAVCAAPDGRTAAPGTVFAAQQPCALQLCALQPCALHLRGCALSVRASAWNPLTVDRCPAHAAGLQREEWQGQSLIPLGRH